MKNILITGGAGFIGSNISLNLLDKGYNVTVLDILSPQIHGNNPKENSPLYLNIKDKVNFIHGSVTDRDALVNAIHEQDAIIHLAAETGTGQSMYEIEKYMNINVVGTALMLDILANSKHNIKKIVLSSTRAVYGEGKYNCDVCGVVFPEVRQDTDMQKGDFECHCPNCNNSLKLLPTTEDSKIHPTSVYGVSKYTQEQLISVICPSIGIDYVIFRYQNVYGAGQSLSNPYTGILSIFSTRIKNKNNINIFEDGLETRDFVYIDDVVDATILGLERSDANSKIINVGTGEMTTVDCVAESLVRNYKTSISKNISGNYRLGDIRHNYADISNAKKYLGYKPKYNFEEGIAKFTAWVEKQEVKEDRYDESIEEMKIKGLYK